MIPYVKEIIVPSVDGVQDSLNVDQGQSVLATFDHFKGQLTDKVRHTVFN